MVSRIIAINWQSLANPVVLCKSKSSTLQQSVKIFKRSVAPLLMDHTVANSLKILTLRIASTNVFEQQSKTSTLNSQGTSLIEAHDGRSKNIPASRKVEEVLGHSVVLYLGPSWRPESWTCSKNAEVRSCLV